MKLKFILGFFISALFQKTVANEYIVYFPDGYNLRIITPNGIDLSKARRYGLPIDVSIFSQKSGQKKLDEGTGALLMTNMLLKASNLYRQSEHGSVVYSKRFSFGSEYRLLTQPAAVTKRGEYYNSQADNTAGRPKKRGKYLKSGSRSLKNFKCLFENCDEEFGSATKRRWHHKCHLRDLFGEDYDLDENSYSKRECPYCDESFNLSTRSFMNHISRKHRKN